MDDIKLGGPEPTVSYDLEEAKETVWRYVSMKTEFSPKQPALCADYDVDLPTEKHGYLYQGI